MAVSLGRPAQAEGVLVSPSASAPAYRAAFVASLVEPDDQVGAGGDQVEGAG